MKPNLLLFISIMAIACNSSKKSGSTNYTYVPDDAALYKTIVALDSAMFDAYNNCRMEQLASYYSEDIEFYHDHGGLSTSKTDIIESIRKNICNKVTRNLVPGTIEVYPIRGYGAIEMGIHWFYNHQEKNAQPAQGSKFIVIWKNEGNKWVITRVVSLH